jgi:lactoylglutathione lyase
VRLTLHWSYLGDKVNQIYEVLKVDGFDAAAPERHHAGTFYVKAPGGFTVEIMA